MYLHRYNPTYLLILYISQKYRTVRTGPPAPAARAPLPGSTVRPRPPATREVLERWSCSSREGAPTVVLRFVRVLSQRPSVCHQQGWTGPPQGEAVMDVSLRSLTTCSYVSDATSFAMRHCTIAVTLLPMSPEPDSFRSRDFIIDQHASGLGNEKKLPCRWWLIDGCKSLFNPTTDINS